MRSILVQARQTNSFGENVSTTLRPLFLSLLAVILVFTSLMAPQSAHSANSSFTTAPIPTISGISGVGSTLTASAGKWAPTPSKLTYQWKRNGSSISGATSKTYLLTTADAGKSITVTTTAALAGRTTTSKTSTVKAIPTIAFSTAPTPTISGTTTVGSTLTASAGKWAPTPSKLTYQWKRNGSSISGAMSKTYVLTASDAGESITVSTTAQLAGRTTTTKTSTAKAIPTTAFTTAPTPTISGTTKVGSTLTAAAGTWAPTPSKLTYQWKRNGTSISGATSKTYVLTVTDAGKSITVTTTATLAGRTPTSRTSTAKAIPTTAFTTAPTPTISGTTKVGSTLTASAGKWAPTPSTITYLWKRNGTSISGATSKTYVLTAADAGKKITVTTTATLVGRTTTSKTSTAKTIAVDGSHVSGTIVADTVWDVATTPVVIMEGDVVIPAGITLTVGPGVLVAADTGTVMVSGSLVVNGTGASPATFTSLRDDSVGGDTNGDGDVTVPAPGDWGGIQINDGGSIVATSTRIAFAYDGIRTDSGRANTIQVSNSTITDSSRHGVYVVADRSGANAGTASVKIQNNTVTDSGSDGINVWATGVPQGSGTQIPVPTVQNNTVTGSGGTAIHIHGDKLDGALLRGNDGADNTTNGISLTGTLTTNATVPLGGLPVILDDQSGNYSLTVAPTTTLTINAGEVIKSNAGGLMVAGSLVVSGTSTKPVTFTSLHDDTIGGDTNGNDDVTVAAAGDWAGIHINDGGSIVATSTRIAFAYDGIRTDTGKANTIQVSNSTITDSSRHGVYVVVDRSGANAGTASVKIQDNTITDSGSDGINIWATGTPQGSGTQIPVPTVQNNTVAGSGGTAIHIHGDKLDGALLRGNGGTGNTFNGISLTGTLTTNTTVPLGGLPLILDDYLGNYPLNIAPTATLTINAGQVIKSNAGGLTVAGSLVVNGTSTNQVTFTSIRDDSVGGDTNGDDDVTVAAAGDWAGIQIIDGGSIVATSTRIAFAYDGIRTDTGRAKTIEVSNSTITNSSRHGVYVVVDRSGANAGTASVKIQNNTISNSGSDGINIWATGVPQGSGTQIPVPTVQNNTVTGSGGTAIHIHGDKLDGALLRGNGGTGNSIHGISLTGTLATNATIPLGGLPLIIDDQSRASSLVIAPTATLTINAGQVIKSNTALDVSGALTINGTSSKPVTFTSLGDDSVGGDSNGDGDVTIPNPGDWSGILINDGGSIVATSTRIAFAYDGIRTRTNNAKTVDVSNSTIAHSTGYGVYVTVDRSGANAGTASVKIRNNTITDSGSDGISIWATGVPQGSGTQIPVPTVQNNTVTGSGGTAIHIYGDKLDGALLRGNGGTGNTTNGISVMGTLTTNATVPLGGLPLVLDDQSRYSALMVAPTSTLTINAGEVIKSNAGALMVAGSLVVNGTSTSPVTFTSLHDDTIGGDTNSNGDVTTPFAGNWGGIQVIDTGSITMNNAIVKYAVDGVTSDGGTVALDGVTFEQIRDACLSVNGGGSFHGVVRDCAVGVENLQLGEFDASGVDWGTPDGPPPFGDGPDVLGAVDVVPWVGYVQPVLPPSPTVSESSADSCHAYRVIAVRGSGEVPMGMDGPSTDPQYYDNWSYATMVNSQYSYRGLGARVQMILTGQSSPQGWDAVNEDVGLLDQLNTSFDVNSAVAIEALNYPADPVSQLTSGGIQGFVEYMYSVFWGVKALTHRLIAANEACPDEQIVLAGYSQGSLVIQMALVELERGGDSAALSRIASVLLLANPLQNAGQDGYQFAGSASGGGRGAVDVLASFPAVMSVMKDVFSADDEAWFHFESMDGTYPSEVAARTMTYCNRNDMLCDPQLSTDSSRSLWLFNLPADTFNAMATVHGGYTVEELAAFGRSAAWMFAAPEPH